uniref:Uncharacterized protein n=1 Tax=Eutreptiella gymnastica TaxID=73025 RepID=A0A7S1J9P2_9EUGL
MARRSVDGPPGALAQPPVIHGRQASGLAPLHIRPEMPNLAGPSPKKPVSRSDGDGDALDELVGRKASMTTPKAAVSPVDIPARPAGPTLHETQVDPFGPSESSNWNSIVSAEVKRRPDSRKRRETDKDEFGSFAVKTVPPDAHNEIMTHVNAALQLRPGLASREKRNGDRLAVLQSTEHPLDGARQRSRERRVSGNKPPPSAGDTKDDDFSDNVVTMGSQNLRSLLIIELGEDLFNKIYQIAVDNDDDEEAVKKIEEVIGLEQTKEIAPLIFKLVILEQDA